MISTIFLKPELSKIAQNILHLRFHINKQDFFKMDIRDFQGFFLKFSFKLFNSGTINSKLTLGAVQQLL